MFPLLPLLKKKAFPFMGSINSRAQRSWSIELSKMWTIAFGLRVTTFIFHYKFKIAADGVCSCFSLLK